MRVKLKPLRGGKMEILERFESKFNKTDKCWNWQKYKDSDGYGTFYMDKKFISAHRASYILYKGPILKDLLVLHSCDNRACVNPDHLWLGTAKDNSDDMVSKNRQTKGSNCHDSKLTEKQVLEIREKYTGKRGDLTNLGKEYGIGKGRVFKIIKRLTWKHI